MWLMTVPEEDSLSRRVSGIRQAKDRWVAKMAAPLPKSSRNGVVCACEFSLWLSLLWPFCLLLVPLRQGLSLCP